MSELDGATTPGHEGAWVSGPGQFAARWNRATEDERADRVRRMQEDASIALRCGWIEDHEGQLAMLRDSLLARVPRCLATHPNVAAPAARCALDAGHLGDRHVTGHGHWWEGEA